MAYVRKTTDEYNIETYYGPETGWEHSTTETTRREAREQLKTYRLNQPEYRHRIKHKRVPIK